MEDQLVIAQDGAGHLLYAGLELLPRDGRGPLLVVGLPEDSLGGRQRDAHGYARR